MAQAWSCLKCPSTSESKKTFKVYNKWQVTRHMERTHPEVDPNCYNGKFHSPVE